jgi:hypothetical protein
VPGLAAGAVDAGLVTPWARRLAAVEVELHELAAGVRLAVAGPPVRGTGGDALTHLVERAAAEVTALGGRVGRASRLLAAEALRPAR